MLWATIQISNVREIFLSVGKTNCTVNNIIIRCWGFQNWRPNYQQGEV